MTDHIKDAFEEFKNNFDKLNNLFQKEVAQNPSLKVHNPSLDVIFCCSEMDVSTQDLFFRIEATNSLIQKIIDNTKSNLMQFDILDELKVSIVKCSKEIIAILNGEGSMSMLLLYSNDILRKTLEAQLLTSSSFIAEALEDGIENILEKAQTDNEKRKVSINEINAKIAQIHEITKSANALKISIDDSESIFKSFTDLMKSRNEDYNNTKNELVEAIGYINDSKGMIQKRLVESERMLSSATNSGLASIFGKLHKELEGELSKAGWYFYGSIFLLFLACIPVILYYLSIGVEFSKNTPTTGNFLEGMLIRAIFLLPTSWLTVFSARKYANLFKLKEHYAYKCSIASSVDGFKTQAPEYKDSIALLAFHELAFNPADGIDNKKMVADHPLRDFSKQIINSITNKTSSKLRKKNKDDAVTDDKTDDKTDE